MGFNLKFYPPKNRLLSRLIEGFYILKKEEFDKPMSYFTFPNNYCILATNLNSTKEITTNQIVIEPSMGFNIKSNITYHYTSPIHVKIVPPVEEITIYFKPLGIHYFIDGLKEYYNEGFIKEIDLFTDFTTAYTEIFFEKNFDTKIDLIESYWLSKYKQKHFELESKILEDLEQGRAIKSIASKYNYSRQYINKIIYNALGKSPTDYLKIHRFRQAIGSAVHADNLTQLSYLNAYYDQSHFIRDFKCFTHNTPKDFFNKVDVSPKNIWFFD